MTDMVITVGDVNVADFSVAAGGWAFVALFILMLFRGLVVTKREADSYAERAKKAEDLAKDLSEQNSVLLETSRLAAASFEAMRKGRGEKK